jgi:ribosome-binding protein aMBF1 (putative translation factor)
MGHWCKICGRNRANEKFSRKGHKTHICKECAKMPHEERVIMAQETEILGFLGHFNISKKNFARLERLSRSKYPRIAELASSILEMERRF